MAIAPVICPNCKKPTFCGFWIKKGKLYCRFCVEDGK